MTTVYIVRHCQAKANVEKILQGNFDGEITERGSLQLKLLAERFRDVKLDAVYTSPLTRAKLTADAVNKYSNAQVIESKGVIEIYLGDMEYTSLEDAVRKYPEEMENWCNKPHLFQSPNGESMQDVFKRANEAFWNIVEESKDKTVAVASHGCTIRNIMCGLKKLPLERINEIEYCNNTGVTKIEVYDDGSYKIIYESNLDHFDEQMRGNLPPMWYDGKNQ